jgi:hypothetical protein
LQRGQEGLFRKYEETHYQRGYTLEQFKALLDQAGLSFAAAYDGFTKNPPRPDSERICVTAREKGKERIK